MQSAGYSKKSLREKLGIKDDKKYTIIESPIGYFKIVQLEKSKNSALRGKIDFIHVFIKEQRTIIKLFPKLKAHLAQDGMLWVSWPKKASGIKTDLDDNVVREVGLENGLVDVKVAAIDQTWSGIKFVYRLRDRK